MKNKLQHPFFILAVLLLLLNDFYMKSTYGNALTGKLSDFAGLFAFPFFFSCFFPAYKKHIHILTAIVFVWWKSTYSQFFIDGVVGIGIPIGRTVDFSDNIALVAIALSYFVFIGDKTNYRSLKPVFKYSIICVAAFSFMATSIRRPSETIYVSVNKEYRLDRPLKEVINDFNNLQRKEMKLLEKIKVSYRFDVNNQAYYSVPYGDTLTYIIDYGKHSYNDTIRLRYFVGDMMLYANDDSTTTLKLINIATDIRHSEIRRYKSPYYPAPEAYWTVEADSLVDDTNLKSVLSLFEKRIVKKLK